jgi:hypothetical protein
VETGTACLRSFGSEFEVRNTVLVIEGTSLIVAAPARHPLLGRLTQSPVSIRPENLVFELTNAATVAIVIPNSTTCGDSSLCAASFPNAALAGPFFELDKSKVVQAFSVGPLTEIYRFLRSANSTLCRELFILPGAVSHDPRLPPDADLHICLDRLVPPCVVYSFGIADNWIFDDFMAERGCEVRSFDPSMTAPRHWRGPRHLFEPVGIGPFTGIHDGPSTLYGGKPDTKFIRSPISWQGIIIREWTWCEWISSQLNGIS